MPVLDWIWNRPTNCSICLALRSPTLGMVRRGVETGDKDAPAVAVVVDWCHKPCHTVGGRTVVIVLFALFGTPKDPVIGGW